MKARNRFLFVLMLAFLALAVACKTAPAAEPEPAVDAETAATEGSW